MVYFDLEARLLQVAIRKRNYLGRDAYCTPGFMHMFVSCGEYTL